MTTGDLMADILNHACPNGGVGEDGYKTYVIETHCVAWRITARHLDGQWDIRTVTTEAC